MTSLVKLHGWDKLNQRQADRLEKLLWDGVELPRLPAGYYSFGCIKLPHPKNIDPEQRAREHLRSLLSTGMDDSTVDTVLDGFRKSAGLLHWSKEEAAELVTEVSGWWNKHKDQLRYHMPTPVGSLAEIRKRTVLKAIYALSKVFLHLPPNEDEGAVPLRNLLAELAEHNIPAKVLDAAILSKVAEVRKEFLEQVAEALLDNDHGIVVDALLAARVLARKLEEEESSGEFTPVATMLVQGVQWRHRPALADRLGIVAGLVQNKKQHRLLLPEALTGLLAGLEQIAEETSSGVRGNDEDRVITIRAAAASLAFALFKYYQESGLDEPKTIQRWREVCSDLNEFSEVKNSWPVVGD